MKVTVGTKVRGECGTGKVVAMSESWCIYSEDATGVELAEPWDAMEVVSDGPERVASSIESIEIDNKFED